MRRLIVNADDFGRSPGINAGILRAHVEGVVRSASLMVRYPAAEEAARAAREQPGLGVGLHLDLGEWVYAGGEWRAAYEVADTDDRSAVERELEHQLERFAELTGGGTPTHIDSHQHVHRDEPVRAVVADAARALGGVPVRHARPVRYCGAFYGQGRHNEPLAGAITPEALAGLIGEIDEGFTELACHPAAAVDIESDYSAERLAELRALCDPRVADAVREREVELCDFRAVTPL